MQRQLLQIADRIPDDILLTLLKCFAQILTREPEQAMKATGPFIRAFTKIRDDSGVDKQPFSAILEEDENETVGLENDEGDNECTFNYKVSNVVTQEVIYSMNNNNDENGEQNTVATAAAADDDNNNEMSENENEINIDNHNDDIINGIIQNDDDCLNGGDAIDEGIEVEMPKLLESCDEEESKEISDETSNDIIVVNNDDTITNGHSEIIENEIENDVCDESPSPAIVETTAEEEQPQIEEEKEESPAVVVQPVQPIQKVTLDDIQREIHEMQMFLMNKGVTPENKSQHAQNNINHEAIMKKSKANAEDAYKVDVCINLKKKGGEKRHSNSKAILSNYVNENGKYTRGDKERSRIFNPNVPNTPEDFLKEKSVLEKINKKKQHIKHLDVSWQKLCDSQKKVYKHSNFKSPKVDNSNNIE